MSILLTTLTNIQYIAWLRVSLGMEPLPSARDSALAKKRRTECL